MSGAGFLELLRNYGSKQEGVVACPAFRIVERHHLSPLVSPCRASEESVDFDERADGLQDYLWLPRSCQASESSSCLTTNSPDFLKYWCYLQYLQEHLH